MIEYPAPLQKLIAEIASLPGLGPKSAERLVFYLYKQPKKKIDALVKGLAELQANIKVCPICFNVTATTPCALCTDAKRDHSIICIIASPQDLSAIEKTGEYHGLYHILGGLISPVEGITPDMLTIGALVERTTKSKVRVKEVIIATNPDLEGEATALYLARLLKRTRVKVTRIGKGLPMGSDLGYADEITVSNALAGRRAV